MEENQIQREEVLLYVLFQEKNVDDKSYEYKNKYIVTRII